MICKKCNIDKPLEEYDTYFHTKQQKYRTRKYCNECFSKQKKEYKMRIRLMDKDELYKNNLNYKKCSICNTWKNLSDYYLRPNGRPITGKCKSCQKQIEKDKNRQYMIDKGGSERIPEEPNVYTDKWQKENTFNFLTKLGYLYNVKHGIWTKEGWKEIKDGKPFFPNIKPTVRFQGVMTQEKREKAINMRKQGKKIKQIATALDVAISTVSKFLNGKTKR